MVTLMEHLKELVDLDVGKSGEHFTHIVGVESKGFVLGPLLAMHFHLPFIPIRKKGKLPGECYQ